MSSPPLSDRAELPSCFGNYMPLSGRYDECMAPDGTLRGPWTEFFSHLGVDPSATLRTASDACHRAVIEQEVNLNIYEDARSATQSWPLDVVPLLLDKASWDTLAEGLQQRAALYEHLLQDIYGRQELLINGALPAALVMANPHFQRACVGLGNRPGPFLQNFAVDVARSPDGRWWVLQDRIDAPAGLGYALQNRMIVRHVLSGAFRAAPVVRMYQFFQDYRAALRRLAGKAEDPRIVLHTPGPANEAYYEHTYLARYLGYSPVEGEDLTTRNGEVFLRTVGGLKRVDAILRRVDSEFCDPLELNPDSLLGIPGLVQAAQSGAVGLANQLGGAVLEGTGLLAFLPALCREVLDEELLLPSAATWWCGQEKAREYVLGNLHALVVKPAHRDRSENSIRYGALLSETERNALADEIRAKPHAYCGQERVLLGTTPAWEKDGLCPKPYVLRVYLNWHDGRYQLLPGGLTRFNAGGEDGIVSLQRGSISKDTWVLQDSAPTEPPLSAWVGRRRQATRTPAATPSRLADHLYWLGRYMERTRQISRLLEKMDPLLEDEIASLEPAVVMDTARLALRLQDSMAVPTASLDFLVSKAHRLATEAGHVGSLSSNLRELSRILEIAKVHLPAEAWQTARRLRALTTAERLTAVLPELHTQLSALESLVAETLPRDTSWTFLDLGRRLERALQLLYAIDGFLAQAGVTDVTEFRLQTLLNVVDGLFTYRAMFEGSLECGAVLECLLALAGNPRGVSYQLDLLRDHLTALPDEMAPVAVTALRVSAKSLADEVRTTDVKALGNDPATITVPVREWVSDLWELNNQITQIYFAHLQPA